jgi:polyisoprenoid-binding protein YceI
MLRAIPTTKENEMNTTLIAPPRAVEHEAVELTATERWHADPTRTAIEFDVKHLWGLDTVHGRFTRFDGSYVEGPAGPQIELTIDASSVDTGIARRDEHLRSPDFLFVDLHPYVRFTSTRVSGLGNGDVHVSGYLEAAGTTVPLEFDAAVTFVDGELELEATTSVDQGRFGISEGPFANVRQPTKVHVRARLVRDELA